MILKTFNIWDVLKTGNLKQTKTLNHLDVKALLKFEHHPWLMNFKKNTNADCRTAAAPPGLLNIITFSTL